MTPDELKDPTTSYFDLKKADRAGLGGSEGAVGVLISVQRSIMRRGRRS
jgi:hypothetical protein